MDKNKAETLLTVGIVVLIIAAILGLTISKSPIVLILLFVGVILALFGKLSYKST